MNRKQNHNLRENSRTCYRLKPGINAGQNAVFAEELNTLISKKQKFVEENFVRKIQGSGIIKIVSNIKWIFNIC